MWQLNMTNLGEEQKEIAAYIIGNLDEVISDKTLLFQGRTIEQFPL